MVIIHSLSNASSQTEICVIVASTHWCDSVRKSNLLVNVISFIILEAQMNII